METIVISNNLGFLLALGLFLLALAAVLVISWQRRRRSSGDWHGLLRQLHHVNQEGLARIAHDTLACDTHATADFMPLEPDEIWPLVGGLDGLEALQKNCAVLVELAFYVQTWYPEALFIAEQLRLNAREIEWHLDRLKGAEKTGHLKSAFPEYAQRAVATYYLMTQSLLDLYERGELPEFADLQKAIAS